MKKALKWTGIVAAGLLTLMVALLVAAYFVSEARINHTYEVPVEAVAVPADDASIERGMHLTRIHGCAECHGEHLEGRVYVDAPPFRVTAGNLTPGRGGIGAEYTDTDWVRAIRHGVDPRGNALSMMPSTAYNSLSAEDLGAMIAYLKTLEPIANDLPPTEVRLPGRVIMSLGGMAFAADVIDHSRPAGVSPPIGPTPDYGAYLAAGSCRDCHGQDLRGAPHPDPAAPPGPDLAVVSRWTRAEFVRAMREGVTPDGRQLDPKWMPWKSFRHMTDDELDALHRYLSEIR